MQLPKKGALIASNICLQNTILVYVFYIYIYYIFTYIDNQAY